MTVQEMIEKLKQYPADANIVTMPSNASSWFCASEIEGIYKRPGTNFSDGKDRVIIDIGVQ